MTENLVPFFTKASLLDTYIQSSEPRGDKDVLELILKILNTKPDLRLYFFQNNPHPAWLEVLWDNGFLINPPETD